ncbi:MAG: DNA repair protein RecN [Clostridiales bacterium]|nr:DNA repair protein RecN [Clostridiales bacterium]
MLLRLNIRHLALIDGAEIEFSPGMNVLTGETGAGKSIVVDAVNLVLGERASRELVMQGEKSARAEAVFDTEGNEAIARELTSLGMEAEEGLVFLSRELSESGRSVCRLNGEIVPLATLRRVSSQLLDIHGQHEHQLLLDSRNHVAYLDEFGGEELLSVRDRVRSAYEAWRDAAGRLEKLRRSVQEREQRIDMLRFQTEELRGAAMTAGEEEELESKRTFYRNAGRITESFSEARTLLSDGTEEGESALSLLRRGAQALSSVARLDPAYEALYNRLDSLYYEAEDAAEELSGLLDGMEYDGEDAERVESRLDLLHRLGRKYGPGTEEMLRYLKRAEEELAELETSGEQAERLEREEAKLLSVLKSESDALTALRRQAAERFTREIEGQLHELGMKSARMEVSFGEAEDGERYTANGQDRVELLFSANLGQEPRPLQKVASGGELSRIMLALKNLSAKKPGVPRSMVFDEIDTGISGRMAQVVAEKMTEIGDRHQVICVTHLPQIAAMADAQYLVSKSEEEGRTRTEVLRLNDAGRAEELARMVGGAAGSGLEHAERMLKEAAARKRELRGA